MALSDAKKSLVAAKAAIDAKNWADVLQHTEQAMGLNEVDPDEFSPLRQALSADPSTLAKDVVPLLYQALVFRGMACYNEAKQSATASSTTSTSKSESGSSFPHPFSRILPYSVVCGCWENVIAPPEQVTCLEATKFDVFAISFLSPLIFH